MAALLQHRRLPLKKLIFGTVLLLIFFYALVPLISYGTSQAPTATTPAAAAPQPPHKPPPPPKLPSKPSQLKTTNKLILFYVPFFGKPDYHFGLGRQPFLDRGCKVNTCETTADRSRLLESDAVVFHPFDIDFEKDPLPTQRTPDQRWIFHISESADHINIAWDKVRGVFNWTTCYRTDCDVYHPYMRVQRRASAGRVPSVRGHRLVSWLVSNCKTQGKREEYVAELKKYVPVDVYGACGTPCPRGPKTLCDDLVFGQYKFYLAFENSVCKDYFTEKLLNALQRDVVPIVYGAADYSKVAPPNSVIDVRHFGSPQKLAEYLLSLDNDTAALERYFEWKAEYEITYYQAFCDLCKKLHTKSEPKVYEDLYDWYVTKAACKHTVQGFT